ncbi:cobyric acid synthase [Sulfitobacter mediterraneus]|uniref:cobyric acid synthase n=1 Tax=Sulfitobacter mediterraneus TaxID=83219 RepID=UPI001931EE66|nr:cobyric acid synthase [Sulfitobacter mediterraneus]MBM1311687.1 cobyric acid synthase [Sulfitobacter mediterraneus]MBM1315569.1 cobyric acid synthase [Sulfitobacter mediterraneus]MBM1323930.1 cobyric acid synthase [Sulfitobacter mediterraneus]MBM1327842.1 cobyric acid synthase [Sulfitobacter mediterraneus]MBM1399190.1 cobyric acid synthase [Sulfitobacter mediterraneus]
MTKAIMIQGTGSNVGKSMIVAGLIRACTRRGMTVRPFKPQNMSNNAAVTEDGGEIGRAQALQARAAGVAPHTDMNPILLKPQTATGAQVIVQGQIAGHQEAAAFGKNKNALMPAVLQSFHRLAKGCDLIIIEGAGSPAETNLRAGDIANMGFARAAHVPVILMGDIDRGGVIAQIVGTQAVLEAEDNALVRGFAVNKFRGDRSLFDAGRDDIARRTGWPSLGVIPWFDQAHRLPAEDVMDLPARARSSGDGIVIAVPRLPRISNFDDLDPLAAEPGVDLRMIMPGSPLPADADLVLMVGSKATIADLAAFRAEGWDIDLAAHIRRGGHVLGLCGGYQMLGRRIADPHGIEGDPSEVAGLGHLDIETEMAPIKHLSLKSGTHCESGAHLDGYEIHIGETSGPDTERAWLDFDGRPEGAASLDGRVRGCYMHGIFSSDAFRTVFLAGLGGTSSVVFETGVEAALDALADHVERYMDINLLLNCAGEITA